jgi:hypothetical protein
MTIALFLLGLAVVAVGPALAIITDRLEATAPASEARSAGMFVALNDNTQLAIKRVA